MRRDRGRIVKVLLAVDVPAKYSPTRGERKGAAVDSGTTSIRLARRTLRNLQALASQLGRLEISSEWDRRGKDELWYGPIPLTELLDYIAEAVVVRPDRSLVAACRTAIAKKHAPAPAKVHAGSVR